jgi:ABC-2 type transport system ATP-binding protein
VRRGFWQQVRRLAGAGRTIVLTTHYLEEADALADRVVMLSAGSIVADGAPHEIKARVASRRIRCVTALPAAAIEAFEGVVGVRRDGSATEIMTSDAELVVRQLLLRDVTISGLEMSGAGLEEAFLTLTSGQTGRAANPAERTMAGGVR